ncbi:MAG: GAF domain-containing protein [Bacteroidia bacterium]
MQSEDIKPKVLYIDDEEDNLHVFRSSFRRNYDIVTALSPSEGRLLLNDQSFDLIISDQRMPKQNGIEFLSSLPDEPENIRMILTGYSDLEVVIDALNTGKIHKYITKPWKRDDLLKVLEDAIDQLKARKNQKEHREMSALLHTPGVNIDQDVRSRITHLEEDNIALNLKVDEAYKNIRLLSDLGQDILANLTIESIIESAYKNVNALMDATVFGIGVVNHEENRIEFKGLMEKGNKIPFAVFSLTEDTRVGVWCFKNQKEVFINDYHTEYNKYTKSKSKPVAGDDPESLLYLPITDKNGAIGVITAQSFKKNAYNQHHLNVLKNISLFVSTALENARAYSMIEAQKTEIEQKNIELEEKVKSRTEQLEQKNIEIQREHDEVEATYKKVALLSEIGQKITATLSLDKINETVYENVNELMDAAVFGIGIYNPGENRIEFPAVIEKGEKLPFSFQSLEDENRLAIWCFKNKKEIIINDRDTEYNKYLKHIAKPKAGDASGSLIYLPLISKIGIIGVITVQSFKKHIYNNYHIDILRSLATYTTIAIENSNTYGKMTKAFEELKTAQMKLVESEKMASLGVLTAGVAHEINNPVNFISAGIESLRFNYTDVKNLLNMYMLLSREHQKPEQWTAIENYIREIQPNETLQEIETLMSSISNGANRTSEIVKGLRNFTRLDENDKKSASVEDGISSTLVLLNNKIKERIEIVKDFGSVPPIACFPGQLNQVFLNILYNAADAISGEGKITIVTRRSDNNILISFTDTGMGMPDHVKEHIFEPFYTTKPVGKGTGLGLSISYGIIEKHDGDITVESRPGIGTTFTITLPIQD